MLGKWQSISSQQTVEENWHRVSDNTFEGVGKTTTTNSEFVESLRLVAMSQQVFYLAKIASNPLPVAFKAEVCNGEVAKFVNLQHDFPTSLHYRLESKQRLLVEVRGVDGKGFDIQFVKVD
ncbi:hypothetical protein GCM10009114_12260 [Aliiglaciecola litoralis]|uniref:DUF6265 domain-containing protein n=2 Tax=Aliiglaciecola litoralis TaxID=582857 RepID=A0ABN1LFC1_9ALTE